MAAVKVDRTQISIELQGNENDFGCSVRKCDETMHICFQRKGVDALTI
jgi:hypothetical protein